MAAGYAGVITADQALAAATAETIMSVVNASGGVVTVTQFGVSFDGVTAAAEPVTIELGLCDQTSAGTNSDGTPVQIYGPTRTAQADFKHSFTAEPSTITVIGSWLVHPQTGITVQFPLGREPIQSTTADAILVRCTAPAIVNVRGHIWWEEG
jgi:hypothetical protein